MIDRIFLMDACIRQLLMALVMVPPLVPASDFERKSAVVATGGELSAKRIVLDTTVVPTVSALQRAFVQSCFCRPNRYRHLIVALAFTKLGGNHLSHVADGNNKLASFDKHWGKFGISRSNVRSDFLESASAPNSVRIQKRGYDQVFGWIQTPIEAFAELLKNPQIIALADCGSFAYRRGEEEQSQPPRSSKESLSELLASLKDRDSLSRERAANAIGSLRIRDGVAVDALIAALRDNDDRVRAAAAAALGEIGPDAKRALPALSAALRDPGRSTRRESAGAIGAMETYSTQVVAALTSALDDPDPGIRASSAISLGRLQKSTDLSLDRLILLLRSDPDGWVRRCAAAALGRIEPMQRKTITALILALGDRNVRTRKEAASGLRYDRAKEAVPFLITALGDPSHEVCAAARNSLSSIGEPSVPALVQALRSKNVSVRLNAITAMDGVACNYMLLYGVVHHEMRNALRPLITMLRDSRVEVREATNELFVHLGPIGVSELVASLKSQDQVGRSRVLRVLVLIVSEDPVVIAEIVRSSIAHMPGELKVLSIVVRCVFLPEEKAEKIFQIVRLLSALHVWFRAG